MTATPRNIAAPPPKGVSSTWPPLRGVWSRGLKVLISWPPRAALRTWRWVWNHSNHSGNSVRTSSCMSGLVLAEEAEVDVDAPGLDVDGADRVGDERDPQGLRRVGGVGVRPLDLQQLARRV